MPISREDLVREVGTLLDAQALVGFVGAGLSTSAGLPTWQDLLKEPRRKAKLPRTLKDLPLVAEYFVQGAESRRKELEDHISSTVCSATTVMSPVHVALAELPISEIWTTNYDALIERHLSQPVVIACDEDVVATRPREGRRVVKMHGGITELGGFAKPVITRTDFESYPRTHPRIWAVLTSTFLSRSMLFLGFSFDDPNLSVMLRLARGLDSPRMHYTVMRRPPPDSDLRLHELRVRDLESSGITVCPVNEYDELLPLLRELQVRSHEQRVFLSGASFGDNSQLTPKQMDDLCGAIGYGLADSPVTLTSLAGRWAGKICYSFARALRQSGVDNSGERILFHFVTDSAGGKPGSVQFVGTRIYSELDRETLYQQTVRRSRVAIVLGGSTRTLAEAQFALSLDIPVIPVGVSGGAAHDLWNACTFAASRIPVPSASTSEAERHWAVLGDVPDVQAVALAVTQLAKWACYVE